MDIPNYTVEDLICDESFQHYCRGDDQKHVDTWNQWIKDHPEKSGMVEEAIRIVSILSAKQGNLLMQSDYLKDSIMRSEKFKKMLAADDDVPHINKPYGHRKTRRLQCIAGIAASLLIVLVSGYFFLKPAPIKPLTHVMPEGNTIRSGDQLRKTVVLADGTIVTLHSNSSIVLPVNFSEQSREITLSGEAFFDVKHDASHPFIVHTAELDIEVLGTVFNVKAYPGDQNTETSLFKGKVAVFKKGNPGEKTILLPNEKMIFDNHLSTISPRREQIFNIIPVTADSVNSKPKEIAWIHSRLKINDESLETISARLQKWYGIDILFADNEVKQYRYSGTFESETIVQALEALQLSYPFTFTIEKEKIIIRK